MNGLIKIDENTTDFSMLYTVPMDSGPNLARARINKDNTAEHNGDMVEGIPAPSIGLNHPDYGDVFAKDTYFRIFAETMQTSVYGNWRKNWIALRRKLIFLPNGLKIIAMFTMLLQD